MRGRVGRGVCFMNGPNSRCCHHGLRGIRLISQPDVCDSRTKA
jgi:hypothetical protein